MRYLIVCLMAMLSAVMLSACASKPEITTDYDHGADFSRYRSFAFEPKLATDAAGYATLTTQRIKAAVQREMIARGYVYAEKDPDLLVNFAGKQEDKVRVTQTPVPAGYPLGYYGYYGYRTGLYAPWPGYYLDTYVDHYTEGTINIDLIDRARRQMVWEGVAIGRITSEMKEAPEKAINQTVAEIFAKYPFHPLPQ